MDVHLQTAQHTRQTPSADQHHQFKHCLLPTTKQTDTDTQLCGYPRHTQPRAVHLQASTPHPPTTEDHSRPDPDPGILAAAQPQTAQLAGVPDCHTAAATMRLRIMLQRSMLQRTLLQPECCSHNATTHNACKHGLQQRVTGPQ